MKNLSRSVLLILLGVNGVATILCGFITLSQLRTSILPDRIFVPGVVLFLILGFISILFAVFATNKPFLLISAATVEIMFISFAIVSKIEIEQHLSWSYVLIGIDGVILFFSSLGFITIKSSANHAR